MGGGSTRAHRSQSKIALEEHTIHSSSVFKKVENFGSWWSTGRAEDASASEGEHA